MAINFGGLTVRKYRDGWEYYFGRLAHELKFFVFCLRSSADDAMAAAIITEEFNLRELQKALAAVEVQPASRAHGARGVCAARYMPRTSPRARAVVRRRVGQQDIVTGRVQCDRRQRQGARYLTGSVHNQKQTHSAQSLQRARGTGQPKPYTLNPKPRTV